MFIALTRVIDRLLNRTSRPLELCCPHGVKNEAVERLRREGLHWGRLR